MQHKAALWILGAFRTSPTGGIEALAGLIPIHLYLKKLAKRLCLRAATLPSQYALLSLLSARNSKGAYPHLQSLAFLTDAQSAQLRSPLLDTEASLLNLTECFDLLHPEIRLGCRLLDNFPDYVSFYLCDRSNGHTRKLQFDALDRLCYEASSNPSTLVVITDASVIPPRNMQAVSVVHFWRLGEQVSSSKVPAGQATALDAELFAIQLGAVKATSFDVKCIVIITDSLAAARRAIDASVYSGQAHSLAIVQALRGFFTNCPDRSIHFWDCPSKAQWSLHFLAHEDATSTKIAAGCHPATSLDTLRSKSAAACLDIWRTFLLVLHLRVVTFFLSKVVSRTFSSPPMLKVGAGFHLLASWSPCVLGRLEPSLTMLLLGSSDSAFSLQSAPSVHVAIARWKHVDTSLSTAAGLPIFP